MKSKFLMVCSVSALLLGNCVLAEQLENLNDEKEIELSDDQSNNESSEKECYVEDALEVFDSLKQGKDLKVLKANKYEVTASSTYTATKKAEEVGNCNVNNLFKDEMDDSYWATTAEDDKNFIEFKFDNEVRFDKLIMISREGHFAKQAPEYFEIQVKQDGKWSTAYKQEKKIEWEYQKSVTRDFDISPVSGKDFRIVFSGNYDELYTVKNYSLSRLKLICTASALKEDIGQLSRSKDKENNNNVDSNSDDNMEETTIDDNEDFYDAKDE